MVSAFTLALGQLTDPRVLRLLLKSASVTLLLFAVLGTISWWGLDSLLAFAGLNDAQFSGAGELRGLAALLLALLGGWLLWRILALAVLQFFADEVVSAVEAKHYPAAHAQVRQLGWKVELAQGMKGAGRAIGYNLLALPVAAVLLITGIGAPLVFALVNAVLLGRELTELVWVRHRPSPQSALPVGGFERLVLGAGIVALLTIPFINLLAPFIGAAMATHLVHRKGNLPHAA